MRVLEDILIPAVFIDILLIENCVQIGLPRGGRGGNLPKGLFFDTLFKVGYKFLLN